MKKGFEKYRPYPAIDFPERTWPSKTLTKAPIWCSVDLRDGNQALPIPMGIDKKLQYFKLLKEMGFKEIEIGFPSASETEYNFLRTLIDDGHIDDNITVQVLVQAREHLIEKTFDALQGAKKAIVHVYNSTSTQQREVVFGKSMDEIKEIAREGARLLNEYAEKYPDTDFTFEYSPESFTGTEIDYAIDVCNAVIDVWQPTPEKKIILNLPATVEMSTPNVYADMIEYFCSKIDRRDSVLISLHTHNDRGTGVAATELGLLAGADRVEGTLFGNGERTGNLDIFNVAMNLFTQGIDPGINILSVNHIVEIYEHCTGLRVHERHPYAGQLVYTAFSGSHQDAIRKGLQASENSDYWDVPYLPVDPSDLGRQYEPIIRINSQSGKGGVAFVLESFFGYKLPKAMHPEISKPVQMRTDETGKELSPQEVFDIFKKEYVDIKSPLALRSVRAQYAEDDENRVVVKAEITIDGKERSVIGEGNGQISAFFHAIQKEGFKNFELLSYDEHALQSGENAEAVAYIQLSNNEGKKSFGVGIDSNTVKAAVKAIISAINRIEAQ